jgi:hypothetical protein
MRNRAIPQILIAIAIVSVVGCSGSPPSPRPSPSAGVAATAPASPSASPLAGRDAWLAVGRRGQAGVEVILASTAERLFELPVGVPTEKWSQQVTATSDGARTTLTFLTVQPGFGGWKTDLDGVWQLPTVGLEPMPAGVSTNVAESPNKSTTVLVELVPKGKPGTTRFAVVRRDPLGGSKSAVIALKGSFDYDALSPDGSSLYVVEHLGAGPDHRYQVRVVDIATGVLKDTIIADKRNLDEAMAGWPIAQLVRPDGMVFTLYRGAEHPFIHALNTVEAWAVCIDLPADNADDAMAALDWGLAAAPDGHAIFAANATLGLAVDVDRGSSRFVVRPGSIPWPRRRSCSPSSATRNSGRPAGASSSPLMARRSTRPARRGSSSSTRPASRRLRASSGAPPSQVLGSPRTGGRSLRSRRGAAGSSRSTPCRERSWRRSRATISTACLPLRRGRSRPCFVSYFV